MSTFDLQDWLDDQLDHNILNESTGLDNFQDVDIGGFGFPHYSDFVNSAAASAYPLHHV